jgi:hypothetical protein
MISTLKNLFVRDGVIRAKRVIAFPSRAHLLAPPHRLAERIDENVILRHQFGESVGISPIDAV